VIIEKYVKGNVMKSIRVTAVLLWCIIVCSAMSYGQKADNSAEYIHDWNRMVTDIIMKDGFSPPVISRIYSYCNMAAYQAAYHGFAGYRSLEGQINGFPTMPQPESGKEYKWEICVVEAYRAVVNNLLYRANYSDSLYAAHIERLSAQTPPEIVERSKKYAQDIAKELRIWYKNDGHIRNQGRSRYVFPRSPGKWEPTPPAFADPLDPFFNTMRPFTMDSAGQFRAAPPFPYSEDPKSSFYQQNIEVYNFAKTLTKEQKEISLFWDCNPIKTWHQGHFVFNTQMISPGGHWLNIVGIASKKLQKSMIESLEAYTLVSIGLYDGFLSCWNEKYDYHLIRPITFIHKFIDPDWEPLLQTPPFPEHTSGHSTISAISAQILTNLYGKNVSFDDDTEVRFGYPVRSFPSFLDAALEASTSRIWGGIHYPLACNEGNRIGKIMGNHITKKITLSVKK
jgi:hypothetical protein